LVLVCTLRVISTVLNFKSDITPFLYIKVSSQFMRFVANLKSFRRAEDATVVISDSNRPDIVLKI